MDSRAIHRSRLLDPKLQGAAQAGSDGYASSLMDVLMITAAQQTSSCAAYLITVFQYTATQP